MCFLKNLRSLAYYREKLGIDLVAQRGLGKKLGVGIENYAILVGLKMIFLEKN